LVGISLGDGEEVSQELEGRKEWNRFTVRDPTGLVNRNSTIPAALHEFMTEPALADAGLSYDAYDLTVTLQRPCESCFEDGHLFGSADESRESPLARHLSEHRISDRLDSHGHILSNALIAPAAPHFEV